ncbi:MAG: DUF433 domain-containing protein [Patescibacteria group bacterium]
MTYQNRIICDPAVLVGKPIIKGTRVPVELILKLLAEGALYQEIIEDYPDLAVEDILAAIAYDHQEISSLLSVA